MSLLYLLEATSTVAIARDLESRVALDRATLSRGGIRMLLSEKC
jgi:hypothetical protein